MELFVCFMESLWLVTCGGQLNAGHIGYNSDNTRTCYEEADYIWFPCLLVLTETIIMSEWMDSLCFCNQNDMNNQVSIIVVWLCTPPNQLYNIIYSTHQIAKVQSWESWDHSVTWTCFFNHLEFQCIFTAYILILFTYVSIETWINQINWHYLEFLHCIIDLTSLDMIGNFGAIFLNQHYIAKHHNYKTDIKIYFLAS